MPMHKRSGTFLEASTWGTTTTSTNSRTSSSWQMSLRPFKRPACGSIAWTLRIITQAQAFRRTRCSRKQAWNSDCSRIMTSISLLRRGCGAEFPRYTRVNNPQVEGYDTSKPKTHILYLDANNLYRWAMNQPLPMGGFEWVQDRVWLKTATAGHPADSSEGCILEVDLEYPEELHEVHNAYPLAPERMVV